MYSSSLYKKVKIKGTQAWDNFEFFLPKSNPYMPFVNFRKKNSLLFLRFSAEFWCSNISAVTEHTRNQIFFERYPKNFFFKIFTLVLLDRFLNGFSKFGFFIGEICILIRDFWVIFENYSMRMLSIRGNDFIACWAYAEPISSHAEHARKCLKVEYLGRIEYDFQKSRVTGPWDHMVLVSAK